MALVSIRLPEDIEARLASESERTQRSKSEIARDAIVDYLQRAERDRFLAEIARASRAGDVAEALGSAAEALATDNEALAIAEGSAVRERKAQYRVRKNKKR